MWFSEHINILFLSETDCVNLPSFDGAIPIGKKKKSYRSGEQVSYTCPENYRLDGPGVITCINSRWIGKPTCKGTLISFYNVIMKLSQAIEIKLHLVSFKMGMH